jgi:hypothetical protein
MRLPSLLSKSGPAIFALGLILVTIAGLVTFPRIAPDIFFSWDSATYVTNAQEYFADGTLTGLIASYSQSFGNLAYTLNFNLLPEARLAYIGGELHPVVMYLVASALFFSATYCMSLALGFERLASLISGLVVVLLTMPVTSPAKFSEMYWWHSPYAIPLVYQFAVLLVTVRFVGRLGTLGNLVAVAALIVETLWIIIGGAKGGMFVLLGAGLFSIALVTSAGSERELRWKILAGLVVLLFLFLPGTLDYIRGLYAYSATMLLFSGTQAPGITDPAGLLQALFPSPGLEHVKAAGSVWVNYILGYPLTILSGIGLIWTVACPPTRRARHLAIALIASIPFLVLFAYGMTIGNAIYPLVVIFAVVGALAVTRWFWHRLNFRLFANQFGLCGAASPQGVENSAIRRLLIVTVVLVALSVTLLARLTQRPPLGFRYPPTHPPLIDLLTANIRFRSGDSFRGRYINMSFTKPLETGKIAKDSSLAYALMVSAVENAIKFGNDLTMQGPRFYDIPVAVEGNRMSTPMSALFQNFLLVNEGQIERIDYRTVTRFVPRIFQLLGIRYVLSHQSLGGESVRTAELQQLPDATALYEIADSNVGQYSPTSIALISDWRAALERLAEPNFDGRASALVHDDWMGETLPLSPGKGEIVRTAAGYRVVARSAGTSLLILPFEFSKCLLIKQLQGVARIGRADFFLTGMLFEKQAEAEIRFRFGPFENSGCRLADAADIRAMNVDAESLAEFRARYPGRFQFEGVF